MITYVARTDSIEIAVQPVWLDGQSSPMEKKFAFGYYITIANNSLRDVQLLRRHWFINDANGKIQEVEGEGVIGQQPVIRPGESHSYNSYCILETFSGSMEGTYLMEWENGERFRAVIPQFLLKAAAN
ncbi:MAG: Co2+/Mg2+ efflux protein ApaG [Rhodothermales bacterium]|nr:Co2+/Mg2+ efflux protein ApaG [Rhodothermales bacterium]